MNASGYEIVRSHDDLFYVDANSTSTGTLSLRLTLALLKINAGCKQRIVKDPSAEKLSEICTTPTGLYFDTGVLKSYTANVVGPAIVVTKKYQMGQVSRLAIAWWTFPINEEGEIQKVIRIFGDRIKMTWVHPTVPPLFPFGLDTYNVIFPDGKSPDHCSRCKKNLRNSEAFHVKDRPPQFLCASCKYLHDTGFLPANLRKRKKR